jgi:hypothetical protein
MDSHYISSGRPPPKTPTVRGDLDTPNVLTSSMLTLVSGEGRKLEGGVAPGECTAICLSLEGGDALGVSRSLSVEGGDAPGVLVSGEGSCRSLCLGGGDP